MLDDSRVTSVGIYFGNVLKFDIAIDRLNLPLGAVDTTRYIEIRRLAKFRIAAAAIAFLRRKTFWKRT